MPKFVEFGQFIDDTMKAQHKSEAPSGYTVHAEPEFAMSGKGKDEFEKMRKYILKYYRNVAVKSVKTFLGPEGAHFDCIPVEQQPALRGVNPEDLARRMTPPEYQGHAASSSILPKVQRATGARAPSAVGSSNRHSTKDPMGNERTCPEGYVPIRRLTLDHLTQFRSLSDFFRKPPAPVLKRAASGARDVPPALASSGVVPAVSGSGHFHSHASQVGMFGSDIFTGAGSWMNVWAPNPGENVFSLSQLWIVAYDFNQPDQPMQTIEGGWIVWPQRFGHNNPVVFIFFTADGYHEQSGWNGFIGNADSDTDETAVSSFVLNDKQSHRWVIASPIDSVSLPGGDQVGFRMHWQRADTMDWWLFLGTGDKDSMEPIGFFKHEIFNGGSLVQDTAANIADFGGEVQEGDSQIAAPIGSGQFSQEGFQKAAFQKEITVQTTGGLMPAKLDPNTPQDSDSLGQPIDTSNLYTIDVSINDADWGTFLFFGGPGG